MAMVQFISLIHLHHHNLRFIRIIQRIRLVHNILYRYFLLLFHLRNNKRCQLATRILPLIFHLDFVISNLWNTRPNPYDQCPMTSNVHIAIHILQQHVLILNSIVFNFDHKHSTISLRTMSIIIIFLVHRTTIVIPRTTATATTTTQIIPIYLFLLT